MFNERSIFMIFLISLAFIIIFFRLVNLMLFQTDKYKSIAKSQYRKVSQILVTRGKIYDRKGRTLALNIESKSIYARPSLIESPRLVAQRLGSILRISNKKYFKKNNFSEKVCMDCKKS